jgi:hypothetical protein
MLAAPLTAAGIDKTEVSSVCSFEQKLSTPYLIHVSIALSIEETRIPVLPEDPTSYEDD